MTVWLDDAGHLIAESRGELHEFAQRIGLRREWFQDRPVFWHYDVTTDSKSRRAFRAGAQPIARRTTVAIMRYLAAFEGIGAEPAAGERDLTRTPEDMDR